MYKSTFLLTCAVSMSLLLAGSIRAGAASSALHNDNFRCQMLDGDGATLRDANVTTSFVANNTGCKLTCHASGFNSAGKAKKFNSGNKPLVCGMPPATGGDRRRFPPMS